MIDLTINIAGDLAAITTANMRAGNAHEHNVRQIIFVTNWAEDAVGYTGDPLIKTIVFRTPGGVDLAPKDVIENKISLSSDILDAAGGLTFTLYGKLAGLLVHNATGQLNVGSALSDLGGVTPETYSDITSTTIAARDSAIEATDAAESATAEVLGAIESATATAVALCEDQVDLATAQAGLSAGSAVQAANNILNGVDTHNTSLTAHADIHEEIRTVEAIARGRATAFVFDTLTAMNNWLAIPENVAQLVVGDNLYIRALNTKDRWWDGTQVQMLESEAPDLTNYYLKTQVDAMMPIILTQAAYDALVAAGTVEAGRIYYVVG